MKRDKSEKEREALTKKINLLENQEEDYFLLERNYIRKINDLYGKFHNLAFRIDTLLSHSNMDDGSRFNELDNNQHLKHQMSSFYDEYYETLQNRSRRIHREFDDKRDKLISERNQLPWE